MTAIKIKEKELREYCLSKLSKYMVPNYFMHLKAIEFMVVMEKEGIHLKSQDIFYNPTVEDLAENLNKKESSGLKSYSAQEFEKYKELLKYNTKNEEGIPEETQIKTVFLSGITGFLGAHIAEELLKQTECVIYCLVRAKNCTQAEERVSQTLFYYFGERYHKEIGKRILPIVGDVTRENLAEDMPEKVDLVIHAAATVKHYGSYEYFQRVNTLGTKHMTEYAKAAGAKMIHISTISVSSNSLADGYENRNYPLYELEQYQSFPEMVERKVRKLGEKIAFRYACKNEVCEVSYTGFWEDIRKIAGYLYQKYGHGVHIAILGENSYRWLVSFMAVIISGNTAVCPDKEWEVEKTKKLLNKVDTSACIYSKNYKDVAAKLADDRQEFSILSMKELEKEMEKICVTEDFLKLHTLQQVQSLPVAIFFTSGTGGESKGVMLSQTNMLSDIYMACRNFKPEENILVVLLFHHVFGLITAVLKLYNYELPIFINTSLRHVKSDLLLARPQTIMLVQNR